MSRFSDYLTPDLRGMAVHDTVATLFRATAYVPSMNARKISPVFPVQPHFLAVTCPHKSVPPPAGEDRRQIRRRLEITELRE